ncbi:MAG: hypothetical protein HY693_01150 [Deltaproteobacteria bacterium]|nr:hypothetical protein [Deltaproteobacteria bacterium]
MLDDLQLNGEYFDEEFFAYFEDVDLDWRAQQRGSKCIYTPKALGYHMRGVSGLIRQPEIAACFLANRWLMIIKNDGSTDKTNDFFVLVQSGGLDVSRFLVFRIPPPPIPTLAECV